MEKLVLKVLALSLLYAGRGVLASRGDREGKTTWSKRSGKNSQQEEE